MLARQPESGSSRTMRLAAIVIAASRAFLAAATPRHGSDTLGGVESQGESDHPGRRRGERTYQPVVHIGGGGARRGAITVADDVGSGQRAVVLHETRGERVGGEFVRRLQAVPSDLREAPTVAATSNTWELR